MEDILVSVIIPVYNVEDYLQQCINSVCRQTYPLLEIILVDDGSTDSSGAICDRAAQQDSRILVIHQKNAGVSAARNAGLNAAAGEYISFADSDDLYASFYVERLLQACLSRNAEVAVGSIADFKTEVELLQDGQSREQVYTGKEAVSHLIGGEHVTYTLMNNKMFRKSAFEECRFLEGEIHEDEEIMYRLLYRADRVVYVSDKVYGYRNRPESITTSDYSEKRLVFLKIAKKRADFFKEQGEPDLYFQFRWVYAVALLQHYPRVKKDLGKPELAEKLLREFHSVAPELLETSRLSNKKKAVIRVFSHIPSQFSRAMWLKQKFYRKR